MHDAPDEECPHGMEPSWCTLCRERTEASSPKPPTPPSKASSTRSAATRGATGTGSTRRSTPKAAQRKLPGPKPRENATASWLPSQTRTAPGAGGEISVGDRVTIAGYPPTERATVAEVDDDRALVRFDSGVAMRFRLEELSACEG